MPETMKPPPTTETNRMPVKTNPCPSCSAPATFQNYRGRYMCYNKKAHGTNAFAFTGDSGRCESTVHGSSSWHVSYCDKAGKPEPATKAAFSYSTGEIEQVPNVVYLWKAKGEEQVSFEGKMFCGIHSPARKAQREAQKTRATNFDIVRRGEAQKQREQTAADRKQRLVDFITAAAESEEEAEDMHKLLERVIEAEKAALYRRY